MKTVLLLFLSVFCSYMDAQMPGRGKIIQTTQSFSTVRDSVLAISKDLPSMTIKICEGYRELYLSKNQGHWNGFFIKDLFGALPLPNAVYVDASGVAHEYKPKRTTLISFEADTLHRLLVHLNIDSINQLTEEEVLTTYNQNIRKKKKDEMYSLPYSSHDCNMTIILQGSLNRAASYRNTLVDGELVELLRITTLRIFFDIRELLMKTFENDGR